MRKLRQEENKSISFVSTSSEVSNFFDVLNLYQEDIKFSGVLSFLMCEFMRVLNALSPFLPILYGNKERSVKNVNKSFSGSSISRWISKKKEFLQFHSKSSKLSD